RVLNSDGTYRWHEANGIAVFDMDGKFHSCVGVSRDIHERKIDGDLLSAAKDAADSASMAKSEFIAKMSHEIRTPLNGVIGFTGLLCTTDLDEEQKQYAENACVSAMSLLDLVDDILDFSKIEAGMMDIDEVETDIPLLLSKIEEMTGYAARSKGIEFRLDIDGSMPRYSTVDPVRLRQSLLNLVNNAVKFTDQGSVVLKAEFSMAGDGNGLFRFSVIDTGPGITGEQRARIFKAFSQGDASTTRRYGGTGLGLVIAVSLLERMGSSLDLESEPGRGSCFSFELLRPWRDDSRANTVQDETVPVKFIKDTRSISVLNGKFRILIAEDNEISLELGKAFLKRIAPDADIIAARDGAETLDAWKEKGADMVFMDIQMPVMNGYEVTAEIRRIEKKTAGHTPVIALTAGAVRGEREKCLESGMDDYMVKPADFRKLAALLEKYLMPHAGCTDYPEGGSQSGPRFNIDELRRRLGGDEELLGNMVDLTFRHFGGYIRDLVDAVSANDHKKTARQLHILKGAALNACFNRLAELVCECENLLPCDGEKMRKLAYGIEEEYEYIRTEIYASGLVRGDVQLS
ncbi:MAG TPA: ATP-binding protein, partial [Spirochaetota bacterium]|nr:ATP-binding protein [Spirochaetota bacterium]